MVCTDDSLICFPIHQNIGHFNNFVLPENGEVGQPSSRTSDQSSTDNIDENVWPKFKQGQQQHGEPKKKSVKENEVQARRLTTVILKKTKFMRKKLKY